MENSESQTYGKIVANVDIDLDGMVVTYRTVTRLLMSLIEFLSFNRHQIPMVFETFTHLTSKLESLQKENTDDEFAEVKNFALERQRELAIGINRNFRDISDIVATACKQHAIGQAIICFGATVFTLKEAYVVNLPRISGRHSAQNHADAPQMITRKVIMSIISNSHFFEANSTDLRATNMFLFIRPMQADARLNDAEFELRTDISFPSNCRTSVLNIANHDETDSVSLKCCKNFDVYSDLMAATQQSEENDISANSTETAALAANTTSYFECKVSVKGMKDQLVKGVSIWSI